MLETDDRVPATEEPFRTALLLDPSNADLASAVAEHIGQLRDDGSLVEILAANGLPRRRPRWATRGRSEPAPRGPRAPHAHADPGIAAEMPLLGPR